MEVTMDTQARDAYFEELLKYAINAIHRVEKQVEKITDEPIDFDEEKLVE
jgi:hypothetical protein